MSQAENTQSNQAPQSSVPTPCVGGCGFYGSAEQKNCCSQCYKKMYPEEANKLASPSMAASTNTSEKNKDTESKQDSTATDNDSNQEQTQKATKKVQKKKNRCWNCRKKVTLAGQFECKCGYVFCSLHRYPDAHSCDFDWKKQHQDKLAQDNKTVAPSKLDKI
mmetsp:Transcript_16450/g.26033  ORF Transcript_16450/g.26033 Transcript_16450/m.26033 type:complete len:163 (+) Transcript_16450:167-655(+)|eukprot:CAMPEP_0197027904 /NCGR_PEP_ID=MMETSP1384-20130603/7759_1 /TAXON_ID=29189 /ORGANISM="Ammonia sp." /LENGTH=162 /DNA_ID=CAMNT_0042456831 /DNA_START=140 /DNA_END=628 /DNA_ORIENTATION=-